jgi:hypothetical protein
MLLATVAASSHWKPAGHFCEADLLAQPRDSLTLVQTIALPHVRDRIDHLHIDLNAVRLRVAAWSKNTVVPNTLYVAVAAHLASPAESLTRWSSYRQHLAQRCST